MVTCGLETAASDAAIAQGIGTQIRHGVKATMHTQTRSLLEHGQQARKQWQDFTMAIQSQAHAHLLLAADLTRHTLTFQASLLQPLLPPAQPLTVAAARLLGYAFAMHREELLQHLDRLHTPTGSDAVPDFASASIAARILSAAPPMPA